MRIFPNIKAALNETARDLLVRGIRVECNSYQDKKLEGEDRFVKELIGVAFKISKPLEDWKGAIDYMFPDKEEAERIYQYCLQEIKDRTSGEPLNPGNSYKIRADMWNKFLEGGEKFSYQYAERFWTNNQFKTVLNCLKGDKGTRQAVLSIWNPDLDMVENKLGGGNRIPCSLNHQFLIRNDRLHAIIHLRSNSFYEHSPIDIICAAGEMKWIVEQLQDTYPGLKVGSLTYLAGSLHAFKWNLERVLVY